MSQLIYLMGSLGSGTALLQRYLSCAKDMVVLDEAPPAVLIAAQAQTPDKHFVARRCSQSGMWMSGFGGLPSGNQWPGNWRAAEERPLRTPPPVSLPWVDFLLRWREIWFVLVRRDPRDALTSFPVGLRNRLQHAKISVWKHVMDTWNKLEAATDRAITIEFSALKEGSKHTEQLFKTLGLEQEKPFSVLEKIPHQDKRYAVTWKDSDETKRAVAEALVENPDLPDLLVKYGFETDKKWVPK